MKQKKTLSLVVLLILSFGLSGTYLIHYAWAVNNYVLASATASQYSANAYASAFICPENYEAGGNWDGYLSGIIDQPPGTWWGPDTFHHYNISAGSHQDTLLACNTNPPSQYHLTCSAYHDYKDSIIGSDVDGDSYP